MAISKADLSTSKTSPVVASATPEKALSAASLPESKKFKSASFANDESEKSEASSTFEVSPILIFPLAVSPKTVLAFQLPEVIIPCSKSSSFLLGLFRKYNHHTNKSAINAATTPKIILSNCLNIPTTLSSKLVASLPTSPDFVSTTLVSAVFADFSCASSRASFLSVNSFCISAICFCISAICLSNAAVLSLASFRPFSLAPASSCNAVTLACMLASLASAPSVEIFTTSLGVLLFGAD